MKNNIKIIITDLDNTLLKNDKSLSAYSQEIISSCKDKDLLFGIATARAIITSKKYFDILEPDIEINHGGVLTTYKGSLISERVLSPKITESLIYDLSKSSTVESISVHTSEGFFTNNRKIKPYKDDYSTFFYKDFSKPFMTTAHKIAVICSDKNALVNLTQNYHNVEITFYRESEIATIANKYATKQNALDDLLKFLKIDKENTIAFGDDYTDIGMLEYCGLGVAVENAIQPVKDIADEVCGSNEEDGVAQFIEKYIF